jgi:hypothetical protein
MAQPVKDPKVKFEEWKNMLVGKDMHSIRNQICDMIRDCAFFQCINESRRYAARDDKGNIKRNRMLDYFIDQSLFKTQLLSIRRLTDKDFDRIRKGKQYEDYSLYNLIEDMKKSNTLLSRENILTFHNLPYDYEEADARLWQKAPKTKIGNAQVQVLVGDPKIERSKEIHRQIDSMTGMTADKRSPDDLIPDNILKQLDSKLASIDIDELCKYVDKYIAHAATPESRKEVPDEIKGALGKVLNAHKIICETASFIGNNLLFCGLGSVLHISQYGLFDQFDVFEFLDEPIASKETIGKLKQVWEKYRRETKQWIQIVV